MRRPLLAAALALVALAGAGAERRLTEGYAGVYSPDGRYVAFERDEGFRRKIGILRIETGKVAWPNLGPGTACHPSFGPDGTLYYVYQFLTNTNYQIYKNRQGLNGMNVFRWRKGRTERLTSGLFIDMTPSVSPDGMTLYFASTRGDERRTTNSLFSLDLADSAAEPVKAVNGSINYCSGATGFVVSPDGTHVAWAEYGGWSPPYRIRTDVVSSLPIVDPESCKLLSEGTEFAFAPRYDAKGRYLCYTTAMNGEKWGIRVVDLQSGERRRVADGKEGAFAPDGKHILYEREGVIYEADWNPEEAFK